MLNKNFMAAVLLFCLPFLSSAQLNVTINGFSVAGYETCGTQCDASLFANANGGTAPYSYTWSTGSNSTQLGGLCAGTYGVTATDANGATATDLYTVNAAPPIVGTLQSTDAFCNSSDGSVSLSGLTGGVPNYFISWSNNTFGDTVLQNVPSGWYSVSVMDSLGCSFTDSIFVGDGISTNSSTASCDQSDGSATVSSASAGSGFSYLWNTGQTTATVTGLAQGWYSVTVTGNGCNAHRNIYVDEDLSCKVVISGYLWDDGAAQTCIAGSLPPLTNEMVRLISPTDTVYDFTDANGYYEFVVDDNNYDIEWVAHPYFAPICPSGAISLVTTNGNSYPNNDFFLVPQSVQDVEVFVIPSIARPGFNHFINGHYINHGNVALTGSVEVTLDPIVSFIACSEAGAIYDPAAHTVTFPYSAAAHSGYSNWQITTTLPTTAVMGNTVTHSVSITPISTDAFPNNNTHTGSRIITNSYDPNDKRATPEGEGPTGAITPTQATTMRYRIRFQNTGTDTAYTVIISDLIDTDVFDLESITPIGSSHSYQVELNGNDLRFVYNNIMLPDSNVNEPASNGYILFEIDTKPGLPLGTTLENWAGIYFDFNDPIITNTTLNTLEILSSTVQLEAIDWKLQVLPNPAQAQALIRYQLAEIQAVELRVINQLGQTLWQQQRGAADGQQEVRLDVQNWPAGQYFIQIMGERSTQSQSFLKR